MGKLLVVSHPEVVVEPETPITEWGLSEIGRARADTFAQSQTMSCVTDIWSSTERKASETAAILAKPLGLVVKSEPGLGENDRSTTGFLLPSIFEAAADTFFGAPNSSFRGWETAYAAQLRIVRTVLSIVKNHDGRDLAIVTHGAVGTLLWCHLAGKEIDRRFDQLGQGHFWRADIKSLQPEFGWRPIA
ncbi:histidine phosphatase family protein [Ruegeria sp. A3M17]|uniref:histidine phosphatase family protein n=1 Tax=Ruegeria sp. A3M17 TaxID=2267229 RepID=UPI000DEA846D|nr:histidine phosphatase family protein [Ruegeria sp. A3M17]RBW62511.1 histidine phosphatase family protein [Ruegeria sp. A3M17]